MSPAGINPKVIEFVATYRPRPWAEDIFVVSGSFEVSGNAEVSDAGLKMFEKGMIVGAAAFGKNVSVYFSDKPEHWPEDAHLRSRIVEQFGDIKKKLQEKLESIRENESDADPETESGRQPD
jgi:hypothetical protein